MPYPKRSHQKRRRQKGRGWSDFTNWVKGAAGTVNNWLKNNKVISTVSNAIKNADLGTISKIAGAIRDTSAHYGYGRKRAVRYIPNLRR